jgi:asparagine synthetase B (glutamine-hydrolysing)
MCGIFAVVGLTGDAKRNRQRVYNLVKRIRHRGPDSYSMDVTVDDAAGTQVRVAFPKSRHCLRTLFECTTAVIFTGDCYNYIQHKCTVTCSLWSTVGKSHHYYT